MRDKYLVGKSANFIIEKGRWRKETVQSRMNSEKSTSLMLVAAKLMSVIFLYQVLRTKVAR